ncbi:MAG: F-box protein, partial [Zetaproteobacteria bacterium]|nr:F-box protein [Zetaproteobacteria bacterium]
DIMRKKSAKARMRYFHVYLIFFLLSFHPSTIAAPKTTFADLPHETAEKILGMTMHKLAPHKSISKLSQVSRRWQQHIQSFVKKDPYLRLLATRQHQSWDQQAVEAGKKSTEPHYLFDILAAETQLWNDFLTRKEANFTHPKEWKKHAITLLLSYSTARREIHTATTSAARNAASFARIYTHSFYEMLKAESVVANALEDAAHDAIGLDHVYISLISSCSSQNEYLTYATHPHLWYYHLWYHEKNRLNKATYKTIEKATLKKALSTAQHADYEDAQANGRAIYRVAEIQAWITALDPNFQLLEQAYTLCWSKISETPEETWNQWLHSPETFHQQTDRFLIHHNKLDGHSRKLLHPLVEQLHRLNAKIFPGKTNPS